MTTSHSNFRIEVAEERDAATCVDVIVQSFANFPTEQRLGNTADAEGRRTATLRHQKAWREHFEDTGWWPPIKCIHNDYQSKQETVVAVAEWFIYPRPLPRDDGRGANYLVSGAWLPSSDREKMHKTMEHTFDLREKWSAGTGYGLLMYMATDPAWRRQGAATMCVQWGIDRCRELGIPAYLEASKDGAPVYQRLGFEVVDEIHMELDGEIMEFPAMMWREDSAQPLWA